MHPQVNSLVYWYLSLQWLIVAAWKIPTMVKWIFSIRRLSQQPTTLAIWDTVSMETAVALVKLMEIGLEINPLVNVRYLCNHNWIAKFVSMCHCSGWLHVAPWKILIKFSIYMCHCSGWLWQPGRSRQWSSGFLQYHIRVNSQLHLRSGIQSQWKQHSDLWS